MAILEYISVVLGVETKAYDAKLQQAAKGLDSFTSHAGTSSKAIMGLSTAGATAFAGFAIKLAAEAEQAEVAFEVLTGSADRAKQMMKDFRKLDRESPLAFTDFQQAAKTMLAFGVEVDSLNPRMEQMSKISLGNAERFQSLSLAFGQMTAAGRLMGQEVLQFVNAGFNPLQEISRSTGVEMRVLKKMMEDGAISAEVVGRAFDDAGKRLDDMNKKMAGTAMGQFNKLVGDFKLLSIEVGTELLPAAIDFMGAIKDAGGEFRGMVEWVRLIADGMRITVATARDLGNQVPKIAVGMNALAQRDFATAASIFSGVANSKSPAIDAFYKDYIERIKKEEDRIAVKIKEELDLIKQKTNPKADPYQGPLTKEQLFADEKRLKAEKQMQDMVEKSTTNKLKILDNAREELSILEAQNEARKQGLDFDSKTFKLKQEAQALGLDKDLRFIRTMKALDEAQLAKDEADALKQREEMRKGILDQQRFGAVSAEGGSVEAYKLMLQRDNEAKEQTAALKAIDQKLGLIEKKPGGMVGLARK